MEGQSSIIKEMCKKFENSGLNIASGSVKGKSSGIHAKQNCLIISDKDAFQIHTSRKDLAAFSNSTQLSYDSASEPFKPNSSLDVQSGKTKALYKEITGNKMHRENELIERKSKTFTGNGNVPNKPKIDATLSKVLQSSGTTSNHKKSIAEKMKLFEENRSSPICKDIEPKLRELRNRSKSVPFSHKSTSPMMVNEELNGIHHASFALARGDLNMSKKGSAHNDVPIINYPVPPRKPPRTFAHDRYVETKRNVPMEFQSPNLGCYKNKYTNMPVLVVKKDLYEKSKTKFLNDKTPQQVFVDLTSVNLGPSNHYGTLKRSFSEEHVYAEPYEAIYMPNKESPNYTEPKNYKNKSLTDSLTNTRELHYMSTPIVDVDSAFGLKSPVRKKRMGNGSCLTPSGKEKSSSQNVKEIFNQSFNQLWKKLYMRGASEGLDQNTIDDIAGDSGSEVSMKDVQERIIYVKSLKRKIIGPIVQDNYDVQSHLFDCLLVSCLTPARKSSSPKQRLIYKFPKQQETVYEQTMIPQISFPDATTIKAVMTYKSETFMFMIKDENGSQTFGYCLRLLGSPQVPESAFLSLPAVVCLLTTRNAVGLYMKILLEIEKHLFLSHLDFQDYVSRLYNTKVPMPGKPFWLPDKSEPNTDSRTQILRPIENRIINTEVTHLLQFLEVELLLKVIASLLLERRVLLVADSSSTLFKCTTAILSLLYPLSWQHSVLPVLPDSLLAQSCTSSPYLFGVSSQFVHKVMDIQKEKVLIVDLDQGFTLREVGDEHTILPSRSLKAVKFALSLAKNMTDPTEMLRDVMISEAFIRMFVETIGHCDNFITEQRRGYLVFQKEGFCKYPSSKSVQMFLTWFCETQMFEVFIEERIKLKETSSIRKQPGLCVAQGLFDRRLEEFWKQCHGSSGIKDNVREIGKKVKIFGEKIKGFKGFY